MIDLFAVVDDPSGTYVATRFVPGARTFAELGGARAGRRRRWLDEVAAILDGLVHGDLTAHDILIDADGHALVTGFGRAAPAATAADDRAALERLRPLRETRHVRVAVVVGAVIVVGSVAGVALIARGDDAPSAPPVSVGAAAFGSALGPGLAASVDCEGRVPGGDSAACTIMQAELGDQPLVSPAGGIVRAWAVRGVRGRVRLQVLTPVDDRFVSYLNGPLVTITDPEVTTLVAADLSVPAGARFGLEVAPGTAVGIRSGVAGARTLRFFGPLRSDRRTPDRTRGAGEELLLRVDVALGG